MDNRLIINQPVQPAQKSQQKQQSSRSQGKKEQTSFKKILAEQLKEKSGVKFSRHAQNRIISRSIEVTESELDKLGHAVEKAEAKGAKDSLIMVNKVAYVVSVENRTVITAMDDESIKENVFTNIDSAVFM